MTSTQLTLILLSVALTAFASGWLAAKAHYGQCRCRVWDMADLHVIEPDELCEVEKTGQFEETTQQ